MTEYAQLKIAGGDAKKFLQGQLTCNMDEITTAEPKLAALCNPQGRVMSLFRIYLQNQDYYLIMPSDLVELTIATLKKYAVFFKVTMTTEPASNHATEPNHPHQLIKESIPEIYSQTSGLFLPHDLRLPELNAVSFSKGCFTGQEIIARMQYRGKLKNSLHQGTVVTALTPKPGDELQQHGKSAGTIVSVCQHDNNVYHLLFVTDSRHCERSEAIQDNAGLLRYARNDEQSSNLTLKNDPQAILTLGIH